MALRDDLLPVFGAARQLIQDLGLRTSRVWIRQGQWDGGEIHLGSLTNTDTEITPRPKVEQIGNRLRVTRITPDYTTGGYTPAELQPDVAVGADYHYAVMLPDGSIGAYRLASVSVEKNFSYELQLEPFGTDIATPDF